MKIAVSHCQGRISPVFDVSENILLIELADGRIERRVHAMISGVGPSARAKALSDLGIKMLVCGAISGEQEAAVRNNGIDVAGFVCGDTEAVLDAILNGKLSDTRYVMPGCCGRRRQMRRGACAGFR